MTAYPMKKMLKLKKGHLIRAKQRHQVFRISLHVSTVADKLMSDISFSFSTGRQVELGLHTSKKPLLQLIRFAHCN